LAKSEACELIGLLAKLGYTHDIMRNHATVSNMIRMVYEDSQLRNEAIKVFKNITQVAGIYNTELLELNLIKTIFANVREFRYEDTVLKEIYGYFESTYHFDFF